MTRSVRDEFLEKPGLNGTQGGGYFLRKKGVKGQGKSMRTSITLRRGGERRKIITFNAALSRQKKTDYIGQSGGGKGGNSPLQWV